MVEDHEDVFEDREVIDPEEAYKHAYEPEAKSGVSLWWVDDCFHNEESASFGGHLQITSITQNEEMEGNSTAEERYNILLEIARDEDLNLLCCSHEYAENNWNDQLNQFGNAVMIDIKYDPSPDEGSANTYGIRFYLRMIDMYSPLKATCSFFSVNPSRYYNDWITGDADWRPSMPPGVDKTEATAANRQVRQLVERVKRHHFTGASHWRPGEWRELRSQAMDVCEDVDHAFSAHHLHHGGHDEKRIVEEENLQTKLREHLAATGIRGVRRLPDHTWGKVDGNVPAWDQPPIRAIAQFDGDGADLTAVLNLLKEDVKNFDNIDINLTFYDLEEGYLWFNACSLAKGLYKLAKGFVGETKDSEFEIGRINWHLEEKGGGPIMCW